MWPVQFRINFKIINPLPNFAYGNFYSGANTLRLACHSSSLLRNLPNKVEHVLRKDAASVRERRELLESFPRTRCFGVRLVRGVDVFVGYVIIFCWLYVQFQAIKLLFFNFLSFFGRTGT